MRCLSCESLSFQAICNRCQKQLLEPSFYKRELEDGFFVYSFYKNEEIKEFINLKYHFYGDRVFKILANLALKKFASNFEYTYPINAIAIDDRIKENFSHTAILTKALNSKNITPIFNTLHATNDIKYAGKTLEFRKTNKRVFKYSGKTNIDVILVDDIVTTGCTILEAKKVLEKNGCKVLFALTLSEVELEKTN